jgi:nicotinamidase-related amidase
MSPRRDTWPPSEFRGKSGDFKPYARPVESRAPELVKLREDLALHPKVQPERDEAVIATGEELHRYCKQKGILFLFFLGFNTNACILWRDYGTMEMSRRGYEILILRDCGTGMESFETHDTLGQTRGAILFLEMFGQYSLTSDDLIAGLPK